LSESVNSPFDLSDVRRARDGVKQYTDLERSVVALLRATTDEAPDHEALVEIGGPRLTYRELWDRSARVAGGLRDSGVEPGDRVAIRYANGVDWALAFFGGLMAGAVVVPVNTRFAEPEVRYVIQDSGARYVFDPGAALPDGKAFVYDEAVQKDLAAIFYTSGTTGFPKGARTTHENFLTNAENAIRVTGMPRHEPDLRNLVSVPLFHVTGCNSQLLPTVQLGGTTVIMATFDVQVFLRAIEDERIAVLTSVPAIFWYALSQPEFTAVDVSRVRWATYGGAPIAPDLVQKIKVGFPNARVGNGFGLTETASISTFLPHEFADEHADSVGFAAPTVDLRIAEPDPVSGVGELLIRGGNVVDGYWNKPEATDETFVDRWLHTGDLARIDAQGLTYIVDRAKDMINRGGENVYCVEVENALTGAPGVYEVAVIGVPDDMMGEKVGAVIVPTPGIQLDPTAVLGHARHNLADFKVPQHIAIRTDPLPRNPGGKILKPVLRQETEWDEVPGFV
jgi:long-chain acyl-CoA synthetase